MSNFLMWLSGGLGTIIVLFLSLILNGIYKNLDRINDTFDVFKTEHNSTKERLAKLEQKIEDCSHCGRSISHG